MKLSSLNWLPISSHDDINDDGTDDWFDGEARVSLQPLGVECVSRTKDKHDDYPVNDWISL
ncbi:MAG: hypothetical protein ABIR27_00235 [Dokdonella sp.]